MTGAIKGGVAGLVAFAMAMIGCLANQDVVVGCESERLVSYVRRSVNGEYWGHPTSVVADDGQTIYCVYPCGHAGRGGYLAISENGGKNWRDVSERLPEIAKRYACCPCIYNLKGADGRSRLIYWQSFIAPDERSAGNATFVKDIARDASTAMPGCMSEDSGRTWTALPPLGRKFRNVIPFQGIVALKGRPGRYLGVYHRGDTGCFDGGHLEVLQSITEDGGLSWSEPHVIAEGAKWNLCEPWVFRSPDDAELCCLIRENKGTPAKVIYSRDEGKSWTKPVDVPAFLNGHRHQGIRLRDGRYAIAFRMIDKSSPYYGQLVIWFGKYESIKSGKGGELVKVLHNYGTALDCGYSSIHELLDGFLVATTYNVCKPGEKCSVVSVRMRISNAN